MAYFFTNSSSNNNSKMKKNILFLFFLCLLIFPISAQNKGDFRIGIFGQGISNQTNVLPQFGLTGEYFLSHYVSLNYKYGLGTNSEGRVMGHINPSILGLAFASYGSADLLFYSFLIPEGVCYHVYPNDFLEIAPYINPLGAEIYLYDDTPILLSCSFGTSIHFKPSSSISITPNVGATIIYKTGELLSTFGLSLNYIFNTK